MNNQADKGRFFPPEWYPQSGIMLTWPHQDTDWLPWLAEVDALYARITREIIPHERVLVVYRDEEHRQHIVNMLQSMDIPSSEILFTQSDSNDTWARDHGPITVYDQQHPVLLDFGFDGWGRKFKAERDNLINKTLHAHGIFPGCTLQSLDIVLEGGSIETDGQGTLLTTSRCLLDGIRNPSLQQRDLEHTLREYFGVNRILWLDHGYLAGDDTDSHIDTLARFCSADTIAYVTCKDPADEHYAELLKMEQQLQGFRDYQGNPYHLVPLPMPRPHLDEEGNRLPATYANFLIINDAVLVPTYEDPHNDQEALTRLAGAFPDRQIIGVNCSVLIQQHGSLHCISMQLPRGVLPEARARQAI